MTIVLASDVHVCTLHLFCDTSDVGYESFIECLTEDDEKFCIGSVFGNWTKHESQQGSTWRELEAVCRVKNTCSNIVHISYETLK